MGHEITGLSHVVDTYVPIKIANPQTSTPNFTQNSLIETLCGVFTMHYQLLPWSRSTLILVIARALQLLGPYNSYEGNSSNATSSSLYSPH
jgi:hypothetical protein